MIKKECFTAEWIEQVSSELHYNDKNLIEKVIRALSLLEMLVKAGCPLVFKGGTALMLILGKSAHRLSIDIDLICPPGTNIEDYLKSFADFGFINLELVERKQRDDADIPKSHSKFFYQIAYRNDTDAQSYNPAGCTLRGHSLFPYPTNSYQLPVHTVGRKTIDGNSPVRRRYFGR